MKTIFTIAFLLVATLGEYRNLVNSHDEWFVSVTQLNQTVLDGHAYWYLFQSRILSSWLTKSIMVMSGKEFAASFYAFTFSMLLVTNVTVWAMTRNLWFAIAFMAVFMMLQDPRILFGWDVIDALIFFIFGMLVSLKKS